MSDGKKCEIAINPVVNVGNMVRVSATLYTPDGRAHELYFEVEPQCKKWLTSRSDPFLVAFLMPAMKLGLPLHVHGTVSRQLIENLTDYQCIWRRWRPDLFQVVPVSADTITAKKEGVIQREPEPILAFSGGTDSLYSVLRWTGGGDPPMPAMLRQAVMVHGFDMDLAAEDFFLEHFHRFVPLLASRGVTLTRVKTNIQDIANAFDLKWGKTLHGPGLGALLLLFQKRFSTGLIAASYICDNLVIPWGSCIIQDHLMSSGCMTIRHDGVHVDRLLKSRELNQWPESLKEMTVCFAWPRTSINCGTCYKCCASQIAFEIEGVKDCMSFERPMTEEAIRAMDCVAYANVITLTRWCKEAEQRIPDAWWLPVFRETIEANRLKYCSRHDKTP